MTNYDSQRSYGMFVDVRANLYVTEFEGFKVKFQMNENDYCQNKGQ